MYSIDCRILSAFNTRWYTCLPQLYRKVYIPSVFSMEFFDPTKAATKGFP